MCKVTSILHTLHETKIFESQVCTAVLPSSPASCVTAVEERSQCSGAAEVLEPRDLLLECDFLSVTSYHGLSSILHLGVNFVPCHGMQLVKPHVLD